MQRLKIEQSLLKDLEDLTLAMMKEGQEKEIAQVRLTGERKIKELKDQLATEKNLTEKARNTLNELIRKSEEKLQNDFNIFSLYKYVQ